MSANRSKAAQITAQDAKLIVYFASNINALRDFGLLLPVLVTGGSSPFGRTKQTRLKCFISSGFDFDLKYICLICCRFYSKNFAARPL